MIVLYPFNDFDYQNVDLVCAILTGILFVINFIQIFHDLRSPNIPYRWVETFYHILWAIGSAILCMGTFIGAFEIYGNMYAGSQICNDIFTYLMALQSLRMLRLCVRLLWSCRHRYVFQKFGEYSMYALLIIPIFWAEDWLLFTYNDNNKYQLLFYFPIGIILCIFSIILFCIFPLLYSLNIRPKIFYIRYCFLFVLSGLLGGETLYMGWTIYEHNSKYDDANNITILSNTVRIQIINISFLIIWTLLSWITKTRKNKKKYYQNQIIEKKKKKKKKSFILTFESSNLISGSKPYDNRL